MTRDEMMSRRRARDKRDNLQYLTHVEGLCGMAVAASCSECFNDTKEWMEETTPWKPILPNESLSDYWSRLGGKFYDPWYVCAMEYSKR